MRSLEKDEFKWFDEVDERPFTQKELESARKSLDVYRGIRKRVQP
jgi:hypothetical protein